MTEGIRERRVLVQERLRTTGKIVMVLLLAGTLALGACGGDGDDRKASIGSQGQKPNFPPGREVSDDQAPDRSARGRSAAPPAAPQALAAMQRRIENYVERRGNNDTFASYLDADTGRIVLITDAPDEAVSQVRDLPEPAQREQVGKARVVRGQTTSDVYHRRDDVPAFWGGAGITAGGGICSSGYAARNGAGTVFSVTAGHCWANGTNVLVESGARSYGTVSNRRLPTVTGHKMDVELVGGKSYAGRVYTGGTTSTTSAPVVGAGAATAGYNNYCHSGRTTGQSCGHTANSLSGQVCTATGCKSPVIVFTGGNMIQGGDSGGTFYARDSNGGVYIRGNTIASGGGTGYAQSWTSIASQFGLSIVIG